MNQLLRIYLDLRQPFIEELTVSKIDLVQMHFSKHNQAMN